LLLIRDDRKISIIGGLLLVGLTLVTGIAVYGVMRQQIESTLGRGLDVALQGKARLFESQIEEGLADTRALAALSWFSPCSSSMRNRTASAH